MEIERERESRERERGGGQAEWIRCWCPVVGRRKERRKNEGKEK
jgi:hypothetical protein